MEPLGPGTAAATTYRANLDLQCDQHVWLRMLPERGDLAMLLTRDMRVVAERAQGRDERRLPRGAWSDHHNFPRFFRGDVGATKSVCVSHRGRSAHVTTGSWEWHLRAHAAHQRRLMMLRQCQGDDAHIVRGLIFIAGNGLPEYQVCNIRGGSFETSVCRDDRQFERRQTHSPARVGDTVADQNNAYSGTDRYLGRPGSCARMNP